MIRFRNGGYRIGWHYDVTGSGGVPDGSVDSTDPWFYFSYDEAWRPVATYRASDTSPKEQFVYHAAGMGRASHMQDSVITRERDDDAAWASAASGGLDERRYDCQNRRG